MKHVRGLARLAAHRRRREMGRLTSLLLFGLLAPLFGASQSWSCEAGTETVLPSLPRRARLLLTSNGASVYSAPGRIMTPTSYSPLVPPPYRPHLRPRLTVSPRDTIAIVFTTPAHSVKLAVQRPGRYESLPVATSHLIGQRASEDGLRWRVRLPRWPKLCRATTVRITAAYRAGWGRYDAGLHPIRSPRSRRAIRRRGESG